jgi:3-dehydroquinate synthase
MKKKNIFVKLANHPYRIYAGKNVLKTLPTLIKTSKIGHDAVIITTDAIAAFHGKKIKQILAKACMSLLFLTVPDSEKSKNADCAFGLIEKIQRFDKAKKIFLVAFGGGVVGDLAGFTAAIYKRGVPYIQVPTTLLAQIDSAIGGKTAVDTAFGKNLVGVFYQPSFVVADATLLATLPQDQLRAGLAEAIKYAVIKDPRLFSFLEKNYHKILKRNSLALNHLISRCAQIKAEIVARDEFDKKQVRMILNFGHTIGHAVEAASHFKVSHGEGVAIGMVNACRLSVQLEFLKEEEAAKIIGLIKKTGLPTHAKNISAGSILKAMAYDKKFTKTNRFVLLEKIGRTKIAENIPNALIKKVLTV